jgi:alpha-L-arabinofuranosidase
MSPQGGVDVQIAVRADRGPHAAPTPVLARRLTSMNIADWRPNDYVPKPAPDFSKMLGALRPGVLRWPAGHRSQEYVWSRGGGGQGGNWELKPADVDGFIALAKAVGADPVIAINVKTGTVDAAKDLLRYLNVEHGYGVRWLQIGNEPDLTDGITPSPQAYAEDLVRYADGLRSVDPAVHIVGPELLTGAHVNGVHGTTDWLKPILQRGGSRLNAISWHYYPLDSGQGSPTSGATMTFEHLFQETANDWPPAGLAFANDVMPALAALRDTYAPGAELWVTEIAEDPGPAAGAGISETVQAAVWAADALGRYASYGPGAVLRWIYKSADAHAYAIVDNDDVPRPTYGVYWLYARHFGDRIVDASSSKLTEVNAHAALRSDGALTVVLANKANVVRRVHVDVDGFDVCTGTALSLEAAPGSSSSSFVVNGTALSAANVSGSGEIAPDLVQISKLFDVELPPLSVRLLTYRP